MTTDKRATYGPPSGQARWVRCLRIAAATAVLVLALAAATGCSPTMPTEPPGIDGTVTSLVPGDGRPAQFLVEGGTQQAGSVSDKAQVGVNPSTQFFGPDGKPGSPSAIVVGARVRVWFTGAVAESYPVQGTARAVQVVGK
jgi:hypothetical protein